jgi:O-antigen ligase
MVAVILLLLLAFAPAGHLEALLERYASAGEDRLSGRLDIWRVAMVVIQDRPLQGTGYGGFNSVFYQYLGMAQVDPKWGREFSGGGTAAHNTYIQAVTELGVIGAAVLFVALAAHGLGAWRLYQAAVRGGDRGLADLALATVCALATLGVCAGSIDLMGVKLTWLILALAQGTILSAQRSAQQSRPRTAIRRTTSARWGDAR